MPLTNKGQKIMSAMVDQYGSKRGERVFYASRNKGTITGVDQRRADGGQVMGYDVGGLVEPQQQPMMPSPGMMPGMMPPPPGTANGVAPGAIPPPPVSGQPMASGVPQNAAPPGVVQNAPVGPPGPMNPMARPMMAAGGGIGPPIKPDLSGMERTELRKLHVGPIVSTVPGRTDNHRAMVPAGSYVLPAQHIASMGHGNSMAGLDQAQKMFGGPYGMAASKMQHHAMGVPKAPKAGLAHMAEGGAAQGEPELVPVDLSGGEYVIPPEAIVHRFGNLDNGHRVLDAWVMDTRKKEIETQKNLPPPAKD